MDLAAPSSRKKEEPTYGIEGPADRLDTRRIREQLGAAKNMLQPRQILNVTKPDFENAMKYVKGDWKPYDIYPAAYPGFSNMFNARLRIDENISIILGPEVTGLRSPGTPLRDTFTRVQYTDALLASIFTDTLEDTGSPARAIQALRTTL